MNETMSSIPATKKQALLMMVVPICFMIGLSLHLLGAVPDLVTLFAKVGSRYKLPAPTLFILASYKAWMVVPLAAAIAAIDFGRRRNPSARHMVVLLMTASIVAIFMSAAVIIGLYTPLVKLQLMFQG